MDFNSTEIEFSEKELRNRQECKYLRKRTTKFYISSQKVDKINYEISAASKINLAKYEKKYRPVRIFLCL